MSKYLSKSKLLSFLQCPRRLYLEVTEPELADSSSSAMVLTTGQYVGDIARSFHPHGVLIESQDNLSEAIRQTKHRLQERPRRPVFEGTLQYEGVLVRADLLLPQNNYWRLVEVKSSTSVKGYHLSDVAIQRFILQKAGLRIGRAALQFLNKHFVYPGNGIYHEAKRNGPVNSLFVQEDVTALTSDLLKQVPEWIKAARQTLDSGTLPDGSDNCNDPFACPFQGYCHEDGPEYPLECLPRINGKTSAKLRELGYQDIRDIPAGVLQNAQHERVRRITVSGQPELEPSAAQVISALKYPRYYLDFETINFAVPVWKGARPYQQIPFQWSCHTERKDGTLEHREFLDLSGEDPSRAFAERLISVVGKRGPILVYNQAFEGRILNELAERLEDLAPALIAVRDRLVDLLPITRDAYYHPDMLGSWSIKAVLPTIAPDLAYGALEHVQDGGQAQTAYMEAISSDTAPARRDVLEKALLAYCERDTEAMVRLAYFLRKSGREGVD